MELSGEYQYFIFSDTLIAFLLKNEDLFSHFYSRYLFSYPTHVLHMKCSYCIIYEWIHMKGIKYSHIFFYVEIVDGKENIYVHFLRKKGFMRLMELFLIWFLGVELLNWDITFLKYHRLHVILNFYFSFCGKIFLNFFENFLRVIENWQWNEKSFTAS